MLFAAQPQEQTNAGSQCDNLSGLPIFQNIDYQTQVQELFNNNCSFCHFGQAQEAFLNLNDPNQSGAPIYNLFNTPSTNSALNRIEEGNPQLSYLLKKINCGTPATGRMPPFGTGLTLQQQGLIYDWIYAGARGEDPGDPIYREIIFRDGVEGLRQ